MLWMSLAERFDELPLILAGPILRRVERQNVTVWLALKEARRVTLRIYEKNDVGVLIQRFEGLHPTVRLGDHLHLVAVTAYAADNAEPLEQDRLYYYDLFFQPDEQTSPPETLDIPHLSTPGILTVEPASADELHRLVYAGHPLPGFVLPSAHIDQLRIVHGSCRKAHGIGQEMLSMLDNILAESAHDLANRPQQLFLTGDQIYADDVAAPLLLALIDTGKFLFAGNEEEVLPELDVPAHRIAPSRRTEAVHRAMLTTTTPQNHLLSLAEYASMYLFSWSDLLWPDDLPDVEALWKAYPESCPQGADQEQMRDIWSDHNDRLGSFRASLPQVRRALANIATYMICDDHEVSDDWYLDGAWCKHVLSSPLGRRVVRNGLLAYALFQAWGNTPEQYMAANGTTLLYALDSWRGKEEDPQVAIIEQIIGMPATFSGSGELQYSDQALHWHYTYSGSSYQIVVMDTRTRRFYCTPNDFPGLLSHEAMHAQLGVLVSEDTEVTVIISATPVLGVDFIESVQFWKHWRVKDNYAYDSEAWALEWGTFQHLLKTVSAMKRVVFLSGDVHYSFGSSLQYWDHHTGVTAKLIDYTSSSLCNEGAGAHMAVLAIGYPRLLRLLRRQGSSAIDFFAWDLAPGDHKLSDYMLSIIHRRLYRFWWSLPRLIAVRRSPYEIVFPAKGWLKGVFDQYPPDCSYRLSYMPNTLYKPPEQEHHARATLISWLLKPIRLALGGLTLIEGRIERMRGLLLRRTKKVEQLPLLLHQPTHTLTHGAIRGAEHIERRLEKRRNRLVGIIFQYEKWLSRWKAGELIIGYNNIGEISFCWNEERKEVIQRLWWCNPDHPDQCQATEYRDTLDLPEPQSGPSLP